MRNLNSLANSEFGSNVSNAAVSVIAILKHAGWKIAALAFMLIFRTEISNFISPSEPLQTAQPKTIVVPQYVGTQNICAMVSAFYVTKNGESIDQTLSQQSYTIAEPIQILEIEKIQKAIDGIKARDKDLTVEMIVVRCDTHEKI